MSGSWKSLNKSPGFAVSAMLSLADGTVMCCESGGGRWARFVPDVHGNYLSGDWSLLAPTSHPSFAENFVELSDGRILVCASADLARGRETNVCEIYHPTTDTWAAVLPPAGWPNLGNAPLWLLPNGQLSVGHSAGAKTAVYDAKSGQWTIGANAGTIASTETAAPLKSEGRTSCFEQRACLLPNGRLLLSGESAELSPELASAEKGFFEFDGTHLTQIDVPSGLTNLVKGLRQTRMALLPSGQVLVSNETATLYCYTPGGVPEESRRPSVTGVSFALNAGFTYTLFGRQLGGRLPAFSMGKIGGNASPLPIVQIRHLASDRVFYCRTFEHSPMDGSSGATLQNANFKVPADVPRGSAELTVIVHGLVSHPVAVNIWVPQAPREFDLEAWAFLLGNANAGTRWISAAEHSGARGSLGASGQQSYRTRAWRSTQERATIATTWNLRSC